MDDMTDTEKAAAETRQARKQRAWSLFVLGGLALLFSRAFLGDETAGANMAGFGITLVIGLALIAWGVMFLDKNRRS
jgi:uncharacterized membrane protein HdeD (DUF308 family)